MTRLFALLLAAVLAGGPVFAQTPAKPPSASQDEFVPVTGPINQSDTIPAPLLVGAAYAFIWIVLFGYLWSIRSRLATVEREMADIDRRLASRRK